MHAQSECSVYKNLLAMAIVAQLIRVGSQSALFRPAIDLCPFFSGLRRDYIMKFTERLEGVPVCCSATLESFLSHCALNPLTELAYRCDSQIVIYRAARKTQWQCFFAFWTSQ